MYSIMSLMLIMTFSSIIVIMISTIGLTMSIMMKKNREKSTPFECGFDPMTESRIPFSLSFFLITLMFLIFDMEIMLLIPINFMMKFYINMFMNLSFLFFLTILMLSLIIEWSMNYLKWIN